MKPGKLYRVRKTLVTALYSYGAAEAPPVDFKSDLLEIPVGDIILFICSFQVEGHLQSFCKLLYKDKVYVTNNEYFIKNFVEEYKK